MLEITSTPNHRFFTNSMEWNIDNDHEACHEICPRPSLRSTRKRILITRWLVSKEADASL